MRKHDQGSVAAARDRKGRFSTRRKRATVLRLLRGEDLESMSRELGITAARASQWRDQFLAAGQAGLKSRAPDARDEEHQRLHAKVGELLMENELLYAKVDPWRPASLWPGGGRRVEVGVLAAQTPGGPDHAFGPRQPVRERQPPAVDQSLPNDSIDEQAGQLLGQRGDGELLQDPKGRAHPSTALRHPRAGEARHRRLDRRLL